MQLIIYIYIFISKRRRKFPYVGVIFAAMNFRECGLFRDFRECGLFRDFRECGLFRDFRECGLFRDFRECGLFRDFRECGLLYCYWQLYDIKTTQYFSPMTILTRKSNTFI